MKDVLHLANQALDNITAQDWERCVHHDEKVMLDDFNREVARDEGTEDFIISVSYTHLESIIHFLPCTNI